MLTTTRPSALKSTRAPAAQVSTVMMLPPVKSITAMRGRLVASPGAGSIDMTIRLPVALIRGS